MKEIVRAYFAEKRGKYQGGKHVVSWVSSVIIEGL